MNSGFSLAVKNGLIAGHFTLRVEIAEVFVPILGQMPPMRRNFLAPLNNKDKNDRYFLFACSFGQITPKMTAIHFQFYRFVMISSTNLSHGNAGLRVMDTISCPNGYKIVIYSGKPKPASAGAGDDSPKNGAFNGRGRFSWGEALKQGAGDILFPESDN